MKRVTTEYFCDICGEPIERNKVRTLTLPRRVKYYVKSGKDVKLVSWDTVQYKSTDICTKCGNALAKMPPIISDEEDTGYTE